ncbi:MAG: DUF3501 family protein [Gemmataceae bacterium]
MQPLELDDLLPPMEFATRRRELFRTHARYVDRYRRVRIGPKVTLLFENRQTLLFRLQEMLRVARVSDPRQIQHELTRVNRLLPRAGVLQAALILHIEERYWEREIAQWSVLRGEHLNLVLGPRERFADLLTARPEDRALGTAHWVQFELSEEERELLGDLQVPAGIRLSLPGYEYDSGPLSEEVRRSLCGDLTNPRRVA